MKHRIDLPAMTFLLCLALGGLPAQGTTDPVALQMQIDRATEDVVIALDQDYLDGLNGERSILQNRQGVRITLDGQGHRISGMFLGEGDFTLRNCVIAPLWDEERRDARGEIYPGIEAEGSTSLILEDSVTLETGEAYCPAPVLIVLSGTQERQGQDLRLRQRATILGDGPGVTYRLENRLAGRLIIESGSGETGYAFLYPPFGASEEAPVADGDLPHLTVETEDWQAVALPMEKEALPAQGIDLVTSREGRVQYMIPFVLESAL